MQRLVDGLIARDQGARDIALAADDGTVRACLAVVLASVLEWRVGPAPTWSEISAAARRVWQADGQQEHLLVIEATMRAALGFPEAIRGLSPTLLSNAAGTIIATELSLAASGERGTFPPLVLEEIAKRRLAEHLDRDG